jgi:hydroxymethylglutaryl-CoA reductase
MLVEKETINPFYGFSKLNRHERLSRLMELGALTTEDIQFLQTSTHPLFTDLADKFVENAIGCFPLPLGIATHFHIDNQDYLIPMAVEETSIIAAASKTAKWIRTNGAITTASKGRCIIGQIQIPKVTEWEKLTQSLAEHKSHLITSLNEGIANSLFRRGGGVQDLVLRKITQTAPVMAVIHVLFDPCDAMGANLISQICESLKPRIEILTGERVGLCILSNLTDTKLTQARVVIHNIDPAIGSAIEEASTFALADPYRAATHNKGILNGIDAVLIATGNDWRAVEAGIHAYAARNGSYQPVSHWKMEGTDLCGFFEAPVIVGTVGGVTRAHPTAQLCLKLLGIQSAEMLSRIAAAVGLVQNLGALRALSQEGICQGHMRLHIDNLLMAAEADPDKIPLARAMMEQIWEEKRKISVSDAKAVLENLLN